MLHNILERPSLNTPSQHRRYERLAVLLLGLGFGLVGLDRWIISPLFPAISHDLALNYGDLGNLVGLLGFAWGLSAFFLGRLSDRFGRRRVMIPGIVIFSLLSVFTGLATGLISLLVIRALMGVAEGVYSPTAVASAADASRPERRGINMDFQQSLFALLGIGLGPIIATQLLNILPSWRWVFGVVVIPGIFLSFFTWRVIREPRELRDNELTTELPDAVLDATKDLSASYPWYEVFKYRNVILGMFSLCGAMSCVFVMSSMVPSYLTDFQHISTSQMGIVTSGIGFGAFVGQLLIPWISDFMGRKVAILMALVFGGLTMIAFIAQGPNLVLMFVLLFAVAMGVNGVMALVTTAVSVESVPPALMAAAAGSVMGVAEIFGGGVAPSAAGHLANLFGIRAPLYFALGGIAFSFLMSLFLKETAPKKAVRATGVT